MSEQTNNTPTPFQGMRLATTNGQNCTNAVVARVHSDGSVLVLTDFGNLLALSDKELWIDYEPMLGEFLGESFCRALLVPVEDRIMEQVVQLLQAFGTITGEKNKHDF